MEPVANPAAATENTTQQTSGNATQAAAMPKRARRAKVVAPATDRPEGIDVEMKAGTNVSAAQAAQAALAKLNEENRRLQGLLKTTQKQLTTAQASADVERKLPVTDAQLRKACDALIKLTRENPAKPQRSLKSQFVIRDGAAAFIGDVELGDKPEYVAPLIEAGTKQRETWQAARKEIDSIHTKWTRDEAPKLIATVKRTLPKPGALAAGGYFRRKIKLNDGKTIEKVVGAKVSAREAKPVKPDAKPNVNP